MPETVGVCGEEEEAGWGCIFLVHLGLGLLW